jgi:ribosome-associated protein YbcJ (S4-like RNA binding protein)
VVSPTKLKLSSVIKIYDIISSGSHAAGEAIFIISTACDKK